MVKRKIIKIDENKCNGCGLCIPNCQEGAIRLVDGKARLVSDVLCDGLGACLGKCPQDAITIEEREAKEFVHPGSPGCPGSKMMDFRKKEAAPATEGKGQAGGGIESQLRQWPVQLALVPPFAPYLNNVDLLIAADCVPFAYANFHEDLLKGKTLLVGCPKLDDLEVYQEKFVQILENNNVWSITYAHMEVPCCFGLVGIIQEAIRRSGKKVPFKEITISIKGEKIA
ncbi:MAG: 4Fe-4S binding protein [Candidatus Omnitrophica bacterium]|nr:4Fe-4S binding protein [Candidatus Omnitrophota bacterium]